MNSINKRYFFKLLTNFIGIPVSFICELLIPKYLGVNSYGIFNYLSNFFTKVFNISEMGTTDALYTKLSYRPDEKSLISFYWNLVLIISISIFLIFIIIIYFNFNNTIWPNQTIKYITLALIFGYLNWYSQIILKLVDVYKLTVKGEKIRLLQKIIRVFLLLLLIFFDFLTLEIYFFYNYILLLFVIVCWYSILLNAKIKIFANLILSIKLFKKYFIEFYKYSSPLVLYLLITSLVELFDRWLLLIYAGTEGQAYFGLSYKISTISFLFIAAIVPILLREFSIYLNTNKIKIAKKIFFNYVPILFFIAVYFGVFISIQSEKIIYFVDTNGMYSGAIESLIVMGIYSIHTSYGQLFGTIFYAANKTKLYRNIGIIIYTSSIILSVFLITDSKFSLNLGSLGYSYKFLITQLVQVNVFLWYVSKLLDFKFLKLFFHQFYTIFIIYILGYISYITTELFISNIFISFFISGSIYTILTLSILIIFPNYLIFIEREKLFQIFNKLILSKINLKK